MKRTLSDIERDLKQAKSELEPIEKEREKAIKRVRELCDELDKYKLDNKMFHPISELSKYIGKNISNIRLVERDDNGELSIDEIFAVEYFKIDDNGHLDYSSEFGGVMDFNEKINKYVAWRRYCRTEHDYIGFLDLKLEKEED